MESLGFLGSFGSTALGYVVPFLFVLTIVVFVHELGHFWAARFFRVRPPLAVSQQGLRC